MIHLITGQPGHGKSLRALELGLAYLKEGREVFLVRIPGVDYAATGFKELESLSQWRETPKGAVIIADEVWRDVPARPVGKAGPEWENELAVHRHSGKDFLLLTQKGDQVSTFVRGLVDQHTHVRRKFGTEVATLLTWDRYQPAVASNAEVRDARKKLWRYPKEIYKLYKSADAHTVKRNLPWQMFAIPVLVVVVIFLGWYVFHRFKTQHGTMPEAAAVAAGAPAPGATVAAPVSGGGKMTPAEYVLQHMPRVPGMPWSAPWHDGAKPRADPDVYCVWSEAKGCRCYTEQITRLDVPALQCSAMARDGIYNPFRAPMRRGLDPSNPGLRDDDPDRQHVGEGDDRRRVRSADAQGLPLPSGEVARSHSLERRPLNAGSVWSPSP